MEHNRKTIRFGVIGAGYMGKVHSVALKSVRSVFNTNYSPVCEMICTRNHHKLHRDALGFKRSTSNWKELVGDPQIDAVIIASPPETHKEIALMAFAQGKAVFCEKPMGVNIDEARAMAENAHLSQCPNMVGYNYIRTPCSQLAYKLIQDGEIGRITSFRAAHIEDIMSDPNMPMEWRTALPSGGALGDIACHIVNAVLRLCGDISEIIGDIGYIHKERYTDATRVQKQRVASDDQVHMLCKCTNGATGSIFASRIATGEKMGYSYEIYGTLGAIKFHQEEQNNLWLYKRNNDIHSPNGFTKLLADKHHPDFASLCPGDGHGTGYQEQIVIEMRDFLNAIETKTPVWPTFSDGYQVSNIIDAVRRSHESKSWIKIQSSS